MAVADAPLSVVALEAPARRRTAAAAGVVTRLGIRWRMSILLLLLLAVPADLTVVAAIPGQAVPLQSPTVAAGITLSGATYALSLASNGTVTASSRSGEAYATFPLAMLAGRSALPEDATVRLHSTSSTVTSEVVDGSGSVMERTVLTTYPRFFTVDFASEPGSQLGSAPRFFDDGTQGLDTAGLTGSWTPDGAGFGGMHPRVQTTDPAPLSPPPFDLELHGSAGWLGIGVAQVPDATWMEVGGSSVSLDYPLAELARIPDSGGGGMHDGMIRFPTFVVTMATGPLDGLAAYRDALGSLGLAPDPTANRPAWWQQPIVDTWGEQMAYGNIRDSPRFTAAWVRQFVAEWEARSGVHSFTLVIDARWMTAIGSPDPDPVRFGGRAGMRQLIDQLHAKGIRVLLWWPLWYPRSSALGDPTRQDFTAATAQTMQGLLGTGPNELAADGLKVDWNYSIPTKLAQPELGLGAAALFRYLATIHGAAHAVSPGALVESGAAAPQFAGITDAIRLNDATTEQQWDNRAMVAAIADPGMLIDGDGWTAGPQNVIPHAISSAVYGVPAFYFVTKWMGEQAIPPALLARLGVIAQLAEKKGEGVAVPLPNGGWAYEVGDSVRAQTFDEDQGLVVWDPAASCEATSCGTVLSMDGGPQQIPVWGAGLDPLLVGPDGVAVSAVRHGDLVEATLEAGVAYRLELS